MCDRIVHRGPDSEGIFEDKAGGIAIGMRRLAIIDLAGGEQPIAAAGGRVQLVFNGEIYNHDQVREQLRDSGMTFTTRSDTEVALAAYMHWGEDAWDRLHGMFAIAIADCRGEYPRLLLVRDRVGIKPLYYWHDQDAFVFSSEMKALLLWPGLRREVDLAAVRNYLALRYVPGPGCLLKGVMKLPAGHSLTVARGRAPILRRWWAPPEHARMDVSMSESDAHAQFEDALRGAVRRHLVSDVPVGAFLSGGVDSNVITALMAEVASAPIHTFTIGFADFPGGELQRAAQTARVLGTDHTPIACTVDDMVALPDIAWSLDEPIGDAIVVPMYALAREARRKVKVVMSGEGADEMLGGYLFHRKLAQLDKMRGMLPGMAWPAIRFLVRACPSFVLNRLFDYPGTLGSSGKDKVLRLLEGVRHDDIEALYLRAITLFDRQDVLEARAGSLSEYAQLQAACSAGTSLQRLIAAQYRDWLPDDILMKLDRMTMAHSLEGRVPFMDARVIDAAARIPDVHKTSGKANKRPLRALARKLLPPEVAEAPKAAFYMPMESYIRSPRVTAILDATLEPERTRKRGLFRPEWIAQMRNAGPGAGFLPLKRLFSIVMLELWFDRFCPDASWA